MYINDRKRTFYLRFLNGIFFLREIELTNHKIYQAYPKSRKIYAFGQEISFVTIHNRNPLHQVCSGNRMEHVQR